jgi:hypothetical protein
MTWESAIGGFVFALFEFSDQLDQYPPFKEILLNREIAANLKIREILCRATPKDWEAVEKLPGSSY